MQYCSTIDLRTVTGQPVQEEDKLLAGSVNETTPFVFDFSNGRHGRQSPHGVQLIQSAKRCDLYFGGSISAPDRPPPPRLGEPGSLMFGLRVGARTLLPLLVVGGLFCYLLALVSC
jgi:hypothetical protein